MTVTNVATYQEIAEKKAKSNLSKIPEEWILSSIPAPEDEPNVNSYLDKILPAKELSITSKPATELLKLQSEGKLTAVEICQAYCHRSALVHQLTNCLTEIFYDRAFEAAKKLDEYFKETGKFKGSLHGIPVSLKDQLNLPNITTAIGYVAPHISFELEAKITHKKTPEDFSLLAQILENEGAVFYVKTTVPMAMLGNETSSNLGETLNSINRLNAPGGSSGGEGSLLGGHGSIIGFGTDIGGSIRTPSLIHGLYGLRASSNRFPYLDIANSYPDQAVVCSVVGPMCRYLSDLELVSKVILSSPLREKDPKCVPLNWDDSELEKVLAKDDINIGMLTWDHEVMPHPPILNGMEKSKEKLNSENTGFKCYDLGKPPVAHSKLAKLLVSLYDTDNLTEVEQFCQLGGEPLSKFITKNFIRPGKVDTITDYFEKASKKYEYQQIYDKFWDETSKLTDNGEKIDCIIMPGMSTTSWALGENGEIANFYTRSLNVLDYTVITIPIGKTSESDEPFERSNFTDDHDRRVWEYYDLQKQIGSPIALQLVCKRYQEEKCIALAQKIVNVLEGS